MRLILRSLWMWFANALLILIWVPLLGLIRVFDRDPVHYRTGYWFRRLGAIMTKTDPAWIPQHYGETVTDPRLPYLVVGNHQSNADVALISTLPWDMKWVAKAEMFKWPMVGWMMRMAGDIPIDRENRRSGAEAILKAKWYLENKCSVMFFPEGTRSCDGRLGEFKDGVFRLAIKTQTPILPLVLDGSYNCLPKNNWKFGEVKDIKLKVLPPIETKGLKSSDAVFLKERVRDMILDQLAEWREVEPSFIDAVEKSKVT
jgi:1-acyl-sn-glycerol-3-phosphate acyltransferase